MRSAWLCLWVLFAGALLGPAVSGQEAEEPVEAAPPTVEPEAEHPLEQEAAVEPEPEPEPELNSEEELEARANFQREDLELDQRMGFDSHLVRIFKYMALRSLELRANDENDPFGNPGDTYQAVEKHITIKKAVGSTVDMPMVVTTGDCSEAKEDFYSHFLYRSLLRPRPRPPNCKKLDCMFTVFMDARTGHDAIINSHCSPLLTVDELLYDRMGDHVQESADYEDATPTIPSPQGTDLPPSDVPPSEEPSVPSAE